MKNIILFLGLSLIGFTFNADAQSCCSSKYKKKTCHSSESGTSEKSASVSDLSNQLATKTDTTVTKTFMVYGNCGMCEKTIEGSLKNVEGVTLADWDKETDQMKVTFNSDLINLDAIKQRIADVGYDSETHRAKEEVYNKLPGCCQYERPKN